MSLRSKHLEGAEVIDAGHFRLDRRRAADKLAHHQLEDPRRYVVELVAAAVRAGSTIVQVRNDADDFELSWDGLHPTRDELERLFEYVFSAEDDDRSRMLRHLAQGLHGARGLDPRWVVLERPGARFDMRELAEPKIAPSDRTEGVWIHVREKFSWGVLAEALRPFGDADETVLLRTAARHCPIPVRLASGEVIGGPTATPQGARGDAPPAPGAGLDVAGGRVWLRPSRGQDDAGVSLVRDGIVVGAVGAVLGPVAASGWVHAPGLRLNASQSMVIEDERLREVADQVEDAVARLLSQAAPGVDDALLDEARLVLLRRRVEAVGAVPDEPGLLRLAALPLLVDLAGRAWSLDDLLGDRVPPAPVAAPWTGRRILVLDDIELADVGEPAPQFASPEHIEAQDPGATRRIAAAHLVARACRRRLQPGDGWMAKRRAGARRRAELMAQGHRFTLAERSVVSHAFDLSVDAADGPVRVHGEVACGLLRTVKRDHDDVELTWFVDGLPVMTVSAAWPGPLVVHAEVSGVPVHPDFSGLASGGAFGAARGLVKQAVEEALERLARSHANHPSAWPVLVRWLLAECKDLPSGSRTPATRIAALPADLRAAPILKDTWGVWRSTEALWDHVSAPGMPRDGRGRPVVPVLRRDHDAYTTRRAELDALAPGEETLWAVLVDAEERRALGWLFSKAVREVGDAIDVQLQAASRRAAANARPRVDVPLSARRDLDRDGLEGVLGVPRAPVPPALGPPDHAAIEVIHQGVSLGVLAVDLGAPGLVGSVSWPDAEPSPAWTGLAAPARAAAALAPLLAEDAASLVDEAERAAAAARAASPWVCFHLRHRKSHGLEHAELWPTLGGARRSLADLRAQLADPDGPAQISYVTGGKAPPHAGLDDVLTLDKGGVRALGVQLGGDALRDVGKRLSRLRQAEDRFDGQATGPPVIGRGHVGITRLTGESMRGEVGLRADPSAAAGMVVRFRWRGRPLCVERWPAPLPLSAVLEGSRITPRPTLDGLGPAVDTDAIRATLLSQSEASVRVALGDPDLPRPLLRALLVGLNDPELAPAFPADALAKLQQAVRTRPAFLVVGGEVISASAVAGRAARGAAFRVALAATTGRAADLPPQAVPEPGLWIVDEPGTSDALASILDAQLPDATARFSAHVEGLGRKRQLRVEGLDPQGARMAALACRRDADGAEVWLGLGAVDTDGHVRELVVEGRTVERKSLGTKPCLRVRIQGPPVRARADWRGVLRGSALDELLDQTTELVAWFVALAGAQSVGAAGLQADAPMPPAPVGWTPGPLELADAKGARCAVITWAADAKPPAEHAAFWAALPLVRTGVGDLLTIGDLRAVAALGALRVVAPDAGGATIDPSRPVLPASPGLIHALSSFGHTQPYDAQLAQEARVLMRMAIEVPRPRPAEGPDVLWTTEVPGHAGFVQVCLSRQVGVRIHHRWRPLCVRHPDTALPLVGAVDAPKVVPNDRFDGAEPGPALDALDKALVRAGDAALAEMVGDAKDGGRSAPTTPELRRFWVSVCVRVFDDKRAIERAKGVRGRLTRLPLFPTGGGTPLSLAQVVELADPPRWVASEPAAPPLDPRRPLLHADSALVSKLRALLGGQLDHDGQERELEVHCLRQRPRLPLALPPGPNLGLWRVQVDAPPLEGLLALRRPLGGSARVRFECEGVEVASPDLSLPGAVGLVRIDASRVDAHWEHAVLRAAELRALNRAHLNLVAQVAVELAQGLLRRRWLSAHLEPLVNAGWAGLRLRTSNGEVERARTSPSPPPAHLVPWLDAPCLGTTAGGTASLREAGASAREHGAVMLAERGASQGSDLVIEDTPVHRCLLEAVGLGPWAATLSEHRARTSAEARRRAERKAQRERDRTRRRLESDMRDARLQLCAGWPDRRNIAEEAAAVPPLPGQVWDAAVAEQDAPDRRRARLLVGWAQVETWLVTQGDARAGGELAMRLAAALERVPLA